MSFEVDVEVVLGSARIAARFTTGPGLTALVGPSGVGKTSVLNMIAGLIRPARGTIRVGGRTLFDGDAGVDVPVAQRRAGYVFQDPRLFPHMPVRTNLLYGYSRMKSVERYAAFERLTEVLGIAPLLDRWPRSLSGGEARRVAIGRALLADPAFLLLDEPLSSLDPERREEIMQLVERLRDGAGLPILMVTHDRREAERLAGQVVTL